MSIDLYLCRSPLQLLNCIEARKALGGERRSVLLAAHCVPLDKSMMEKLLVLYQGWDEVHFFPLYPLRNQIATMRRVLRARPLVERLVIGDSTQFLNLLINRVLRPRSVVMVDDGASTLSRAPFIADRTLHLRRKNLAPKSPLLGRLKAWLGLEPTYLYRADFFTFYDLAKFGLHGSRRNTLAFCRSCLAQKPLSDETWFIGSNFRGDLLLDPASYDGLVERLAEFEDLSRVVYIPHRKEPDDYLATLAARHGFTVRRFEAMVELEVLKAAALPARIISFGSSAVNTLHELIARPTVVYQVPPDLIAAHRWKVLEEQYALGRSKGYTMIDLASGQTDRREGKE